jgi:hypothetical protein
LGPLYPPPNFQNLPEIERQNLKEIRNFILLENLKKKKRSITHAVLTEKMAV